MVEEKVGANTTARYVWSPVYPDALVLRERDTDGNGTLDERLWVTQDANYNVTALVDGTGTVVERYAYDPFGVQTVYDASYAVRGAGSSYGWVYGFQGLRYDPTSGLNEARFRWSSPTLGRWVSLDPIRFEGRDANLYGFVGQNPVARTDPLGLIDPPPVTVTSSPISGVSPQQYGWIQSGLNGKATLEQVRANVPADILRKAIEFYEERGRTVKETGGPARAFNKARADFLRGVGKPPGNLATFAASQPGRFARLVQAGTALARCAPPAALAGGLLWLSDSAPEPPPGPVKIPGSGKGGIEEVTIPQNSWLIQERGTKRGVIQTWRLPDKRIVEIEVIK